MSLIVSDSTTLIVLERLDNLSLLCNLFERILLPSAVFNELQVGNSAINAHLEWAQCYEVVAVPASERLLTLYQWLDTGEAQAIELALTRHLPLIIDERKGRKIALQHKLFVIGLAGLLVLAAKQGCITSESALFLLEQAVQVGYRLSGTLYHQVQDTLRKL